MTLRDEIKELEAKLTYLRHKEATGGCAEVGHRWKFIGGSNAGCGPNCCCSVPVCECKVCRDCDYGEPERAKVIAECAAGYPT